MRIEDVLELPSMPLAGPSYPKGPYRFIDREYMIISYETDPDIIREQLPEPLSRSTRRSSTTSSSRCRTAPASAATPKSGLVIPCRYQGEEMNFVAQMYLDDDPPIVAGREIWGFPKKYAHPKLEIVKDTLTGTLEYSGQLVAMGTMAYKHESMAGNGVKTTATLAKTQVNLKLIPGVDGAPGTLPAGLLQPHRDRREGLMDRTRAGCTWCRMSMRRSPICRCAASSARTISSPT